HAARRDGGAVHAVQAGGEDLGRARLAGAPGADEQVGVVDLLAPNRVGERAHHLLLADHVGERARTVATVERRPGGHSYVESRGCGGPARKRSAGGAAERKMDRAPSFETGSEARPLFDDSGPALPSRLEVTA